MFTAIQARNVANEKCNHNYYKKYRWFCTRIMRGITKAAKNGHITYDWYTTDCKHITLTVLKQIADELMVYGYNCNVSTLTDEQNKHKYAQIRISWAS